MATTTSLERPRRRTPTATGSGSAPGRRAALFPGARRDVRGAARCHPPAAGRRSRSDAALEPFLEVRLILRDLPRRLAARQRGDELAEPVADEVELDRDPRARPAVERLDGPRADRPHRTVRAVKRDQPGRVVLRHLVADVALAAGHLAPVDGSRADPCRPVGLDPRADDVPLPLAVAVELVEVGENLLRSAIDLDALPDHLALLLSVRGTAHRLDSRPCRSGSRSSRAAPAGSAARSASGWRRAGTRPRSPTCAPRRPRPSPTRSRPAACVRSASRSTSPIPPRSTPLSSARRRSSARLRSSSTTPAGTSCTHSSRPTRASGAVSSRS